MNYYKRFTDFCAGFAAFAALIYLLRSFMPFSPEEAEGISQKLKLFFERGNSNHRAYLVLIALLAISVTVSLIFERLPYISFAVSHLPFLHMIFMLDRGTMQDDPMIYLLLVSLHLSGNILYAIGLDRADGKRRAFICANVCGAMIFALAMLVKRTAELIAPLTEDEIRERGSFALEIFGGLEGGADKLIMRIAVIALVSVAISFVLRDIYFIDAACAAVPLAYTVYLVAAEKLTALPLTIFMLTLAYFIFKLTLTFFEPMAKKRG